MHILTPIHHSLCKVCMVCRLIQCMFYDYRTESGLRLFEDKKGPFGTTLMRLTWGSKKKRRKEVKERRKSKKNRRKSIETRADRSWPVGQDRPDRSGPVGHMFWRTLKTADRSWPVGHGCCTKRENTPTGHDRSEVVAGPRLNWARPVTTGRACLLDCWNCEADRSRPVGRA